MNLLRNGNTEGAISLIKNGTDLNKTDKYGNTPLLISLKQKNIEVAKFLIENGADVNIADKGLYYPILWAAKNHTEITKILISQGAEVNVKDKNHNTPLILATKKGNIKIIKLLIENDANVNATDKEGYTPYRFAKEKNNTKIMTMLEEKGAKFFVNIEKKHDPKIVSNKKCIADLIQEVDIDDNLQQESYKRRCKQEEKNKIASFTNEAWNLFDRFIQILPFAKGINIIRIIIGCILCAIPFILLICFNLAFLDSLIRGNLDKLGMKLFSTTCILIALMIPFGIGKFIVGDSFDDLFGFSRWYDFKEKAYDILFGIKRWITIGIFVGILTLSIGFYQHFAQGYPTLFFYGPLLPLGGGLVAWILYGLSAYRAAGADPSEVYINVAPGEGIGMIFQVIAFMAMQILFILIANSIFFFLNIFFDLPNLGSFLPDFFIAFYAYKYY